MSPDPVQAKIPRGTAVAGPFVTVHFDGACEPPKGGGVATYGFTVEGDVLNHEERGLAVAPWSPRATNNVAEYVGAIRSLEWLKAQGFQGTVLLLGDSQLVIRQLQGEYEVRAAHLKDYHTHLTALAKSFQEVRPIWIPREENARADELTKLALREEARISGRSGRPATLREANTEGRAPESGERGT